MGALALGLLALVVAIAALRWFAGADPKALAKGVRWFGAGLLVLVAVGLAAVDRVGLAMLAAGMAWALFTGGRAWPRGWPYRFGHRGGLPPGADTKTRVRTEWLEMDLDHATGELNGIVLKGAHSGPLESLSKAALALLLRDVEASDPESARLLESYLERRFGVDWRSSPEFGPPPRSGMTRPEAFAVLGLAEGASAEEIRAAHRRLIMQIHPDRGGSDYLAAKINEAKDFLLAP